MAAAALPPREARSQSASDILRPEQQYPLPARVFPTYLVVPTEYRNQLLTFRKSILSAERFVTPGQPFIPEGLRSAVSHF